MFIEFLFFILAGSFLIGFPIFCNTLGAKWKDNLARFSYIIFLCLILAWLLFALTAKTEYVDEYTVKIRYDNGMYYILLKDLELINLKDRFDGRNLFKEGDSLKDRFDGRNLFKEGDSLKVKIPAKYYYGVRFLKNPEIFRIEEE